MVQSVLIATFDRGVFFCSYIIQSCMFMAWKLQRGLLMNVSHVLNATAAFYGQVSVCGGLTVNRFRRICVQAPEQYADWDSTQLRRGQAVSNSCFFIHKLERLRWVGVPIVVLCGLFNGSDGFYRGIK